MLPICSRTVLILIHLILYSNVSATNTDVCESDQSEYETLKIPEIDVSKFISGDIPTRLNIANMFDYGFNKYGMVRIINHDIPQSLVDTIFNDTKHFFHDTNEIKMRYNFGDFGAKGYIPKGKESFYTNKNGIKQTEPTESFHFVANYSDTYSMQCGLPYSPNSKDNGLPFHFTESILSLYYAKLRKLLRNIHLIASIALGFDENIFEMKMNENSFLGLRLTYYYEIINDLKSTECENNYYLRLNEHRDFAGFAFVQNDRNNADGFQLLYNGQYFDIDFVENSFLMVGGDFIRFFTNNYWKSCLHRVLTKTKQERFTMIAFSGTDLEETIDKLENCEKCNIETRKFKPIKGQEWLLKRVNDANAMNDA